MLRHVARVRFARILLGESTAGGQLPVHGSWNQAGMGTHHADIHTELMKVAAGAAKGE